MHFDRIDIIIHLFDLLIGCDVFLCIVCRLCCACRYQNFYLRDEEDMLVNGVIIKQSLVDQVENTAFSIVPNNMTEVRTEK